MITILRTIADVQAWRDSLPVEKKLALVPTMGALHAGHMSLVDVARKHAEITIASIFVNPLQFGPNEDLSKYPRPIEKDLALLDDAGVDAVFLPEVQELYPEGASTYVIEEAVSAPLCGAMRPGHFKGVTTVVLKLFNIVAPDVAVFGQKDAQQCTVIERMVRDLNVRVKIIRALIVREADGLAMSSRNVYLNAADRKAATALFRSLQAADQAFQGGERDAATLAKIGRAVLATEPGITVQYWDVRHPESLDDVAVVTDDGAVFAVAAFLGTTRLIDNFIVKP